MILGITGGTGCGKTTLLDEIRRAGGMVLDCDAIYHTLLRTDRDMLTALKMRFPSAFTDGTLDRKALGRIVFSDAEALAALNAITHRCVRREVERALTAHPPLAAIDAISLIEAELAPLCDLTIAVTAPLEARVTRLCARDGISREYALSRIRAQHENAWFSAQCDYTLTNDSDPNTFRAKCVAFLKETCIIDT